MKTNADYTTSFRNYGNITVPKGTRLTHKTAMGIDEKYHFVDDFSWVSKSYPDYSVALVMDLSTYGLNVPKEYVDYEVNNLAKLIEYAYPTSTTATKQGMGKTGCYFVSLYKSETALDRVEILKYFEIKEDAIKYAESLPYPYNFMHKYFN